MAATGRYRPYKEMPDNGVTSLADRLRQRGRTAGDEDDLEQIVVSTKRAALALDCNPAKVAQLVAQGKLRAVRLSGKGTGKKSIVVESIYDLVAELVDAS